MYFFFSVSSKKYNNQLNTSIYAGFLDYKKLNRCVICQKQYTIIVANKQIDKLVQQHIISERKKYATNNGI